jgi:integrase
LVDLFRGAGVLGIPVKAITPQHFTSVQRVLESSSRTLRTQKNLINSARSVFNWGGPDGMGLFDNAIHFGPRFRSANSLEIKVEQEEAGRIRFIDRDTINAAINGASEQMRVAILLGINCGFYPGDSVAITLDHLHMDGEIPYHDFRRVKTKERRMAALWKETVSAIKGYVETARWPIDAAESRLLLTQYGLPYTRAGEARKLIETFGRLLDRIGKRVRGVGLGSLRHTYATVVDDVPDQTMIDLTMGHTNANLQKGTYKQLNLNELKRLKVISEVVHSWLLGPGQ